MNSRNKISRMLPVLVVSLTIASTAFAQLPSDGELALIMIDMSGSMTERTPDGDVKFDIAIQGANEFLDEVYDMREYALWTFSETSANELADFDDHLTKEQVRSLVNSLTLPNPSWLTPFAGRFCDAVDHLIDTQQERDDNTPPSVPPFIYDKRIALFTDGIENNTERVHECWGPTSDESPPWEEVDSWQWKIYNKASTGNAYTPPVSGLPATVIVDVLSIFDFIPSSYSSRTFMMLPVQSVSPSAIMSVSADMGEPVSAKTLASISTIQAPVNLMKSEAQLAIEIYSGVTMQTGGIFITATEIEDVPFAGDGDDDGCVDIDDYNLVVQNYGKSFSYNHPADLNRDRRVDYDDYLTLVQNWGDGC